MAPLIFALALLAQDAPATEAPAPEASPDGPVATAVPRKQTVAPLPIQGGPVTPPSDDYGYVGWCYGAMSGYVELYDRAMPEVTRIERAWPTPSTEENIREVYPAQRDEAKRNLVQFAKAMEAAERASPTPIQDQGAAAIRRGRGVWTGAGNVPKAQLAQFWMSWSPPARCEETARTLEARSNLFGQALSYNAPGAAPVAPPPPPPEAGMPLAAEASAPTEPAVTEGPEADPVPAGGAPTVMVDSVASGDVDSDADVDVGDDADIDTGVPAATDLPQDEAVGDATASEVAPTVAPEGAAEIASDPAEPEPTLDASALPAIAPEAVAPVNDEASPTAIDDLLPTEEVTVEPVVAEPPPPAPEQPAQPKRKRVEGLRGPQ